MKLKAPFVYFGGKSRVAPLIWDRIGDVDNLIEPFCGSAAFLLARPHAPRIETINDADCYVSNFWRATKCDPEGVAEWADWPVNECDLHANHRWLVLGEYAAEFRRRMRTDPDFFDAKVAGRWVQGICCWIGSGWCAVEDSASSQLPKLSSADGVPSTPSKGSSGKVVHARGQDNRKPRIDGGEGQYGHGIHAKMPNSDRRGMDAAPEPSEQIPLIGDPPRGGHRAAEGYERVKGLREKEPRLSTPHGQGAHGRPQLADAFSRGRGVHGNDAMGTCEQRRAWLIDWFQRLRDRLRTVRVCCGDWLRVCDSESVTTRLGLTGIFLDPPYGLKADRTARLYSTDSLTVAEDVRRYCLERGSDPAMRIVLAGYAGEGHESLEKHGWECIAWEAQGGYGNRSEKGRKNAKRERLWVSPHCVDLGLPLYEGLEV